MTNITTMAELIARWNTDEGKPYKGRLIDMNAYEHAPDDIGCMCAQGQVLHLVGGWSVDRLNKVRQQAADAETAKLLNISRAHAALLRIVNDSLDGAPSVVLTDPGKVLGDQWSKLLDFWCHLDGMTYGQWAAARDAAGASSEVQGAEVMRAKEASLFFLPTFGFADPSDIPPRPADYGVVPSKEPKP